ncbi:hypothetical protein [Granulicella mallensis]|uniref:Uncharacterized protein n=1 Tax=Granulicella mallensis TaxID=940614 RepID=A0A7W7ZVI5_9BACT|nr:hypothetical protein [Granulicella mallensis]MBB5066880.1 hypothetical protein [Granulicella mallensis]
MKSIINKLCGLFKAIELMDLLFEESCTLKVGTVAKNFSYSTPQPLHCDFFHWYDFSNANSLQPHSNSG